MSFIKYDLVFLVLFTLGVAIFLYTRRHNLKRQGIMYLYRTQVGVKFIDVVSIKYAKILRPLQYVIVTCGYLLMGAMIWFLATFTYTYTMSEALVRAAKIPPILPLVPYLPEIFKINFLPPFYFTYWIVIIAIVAVTHEFAHGIIARLNNIKVKSTGFGFLGPFLAAFVEPDEKHMQKAKIFPQLSILAAGTFANVLMTVLFGAILIVFFNLSFMPAGIYFNSYATTAIAVGSISAINGVPADFNNINYTSTELLNITSNGDTYLLTAGALQEDIANNLSVILVYDNAPAVKAGLVGPISNIGGMSIRNLQDLKDAIANHKPGDKVIIQGMNESGTFEKTITLGEKNGKAYLGVGFVAPDLRGPKGWIYRIISKIKDPSIYYIPTFDGDFAWFIYNLLWWTVMINFSVALVNMLPVGIFDGGRFFYLTVLAITKKETWAKKAFSISTWLILAVFVWLMIRWVIAFI